MCELLALTTSQPAQLTFSLHTLAAHGGTAGVAHDGWGVAIYRGTDVALFREPSAGAESKLVRFLAAGVALAHGDTAAVFIASVPLANEAWQPLEEGELMAVRDGEVIANLLPSLVRAETDIRITQ